tara:strand:- start:1912 stop:3939 length:2028 start_codon:yes stop_codon:yes gene_type:complete
MNYGFELNEFDPFFNFRATEYIVDNGFIAYFQWNDDKTWYPYGRDVSATSQIMLHTTAAITYQIFGGNSSLYDFTILFPVIVGSLTVVVIFALVRLFGGTNAGLIASLLFAIALPITMRGLAGWFKSEPLGIFYGLLGLYLFLSAINSQNKKIIISKIIFGGIIMGFGLASWGGNQFLIIPIGLFILILPFVRKDHKFLLWSIPLFVTVFLLISSMFERPGPSFVTGFGGLSLILPTVFLLFCIFVQKISNDKNKIRNGLFLLLGFIIIGSFLVIVNENSNFLSMPSYRYLNAINPFLTTLDPLTDSVAEHATTTTALSFFFNSILMIFAGLGVWIILSKKISKTGIIVKNDMKAFMLIMGITSVYISSAFIRLELFASLSLIILASVGLSILTKEIFQIKYFGKKNYALKTSYFVIILFLFLIPLVYPTQNWISVADSPPTILNGGTTYPVSSDWLEALEWIKLNTPVDSVVASWWDYGYWITTLTDRATINDNATLIDSRIKQMAQIFVSSPDESWHMLKEMNADYLLVYVSAEKLIGDVDGKSVYWVGGGGDESKLLWFIRIAGEQPQKYLLPDGQSPTNYFWDETLLGKLIPFKTIFYANMETQELSNTFEYGYIPINVIDIKYPSDGNNPFKLVYGSPTLSYQPADIVSGVLVYEINKNYVPEIIFDELN